MTVMSFAPLVPFLRFFQEGRDAEKIACPLPVMKIVLTMPAVGLIYHLIPMKRHNK